MVVADDHTIVRRGLVSLISMQTGMEVVGEAENGRMAVALVMEREPDVILMDIGMPELNGLEATRQIRKYTPNTKVLVLSGYDNEEYIREIVLCGANGYLLKSSGPEELLKGIVEVSRGRRFFSPIVSVVVDKVDRNDHEPRRLQEPLTQREREILQLIAEGNMHSQIAGMLHISPRTVDTHRNNILKKLGLHDAAGLVSYAIKNGIVILPRR